MNERIKELAKECGYQHIPLTSLDKVGDFDYFDIEKFAELIVRECAEICMKEIDIGWAMAPKSPWMAKQILEHFGVE